MADVRLSIKDRFALVARAAMGSFPTDPNTIGGRLLAGVISPGGTPPARGIQDFLKSYSEMPWLRAVASRISYDIASVHWGIFVQRQMVGGKRVAVRNKKLQRMPAPHRHALLKAAQAAGDIEEITDHPALNLLDRANAIQTGLQMRKVTQLHMDLAGDGFWLLERDALGTPIAIWPVPPHWVLGTPHPRRPFYRVSFRGWQGQIPESEIIWFSDVDPLNPYGRGTGTAQALADELETDEYTAKHTKAYFYNRARPDLIISPKGDGDLHEDQVERLEEAWNAKNQGFWRAFKPFFLRRAVEIKEIDQNFRSQQLVQLREFERNTILQIFGVSPETLGIISPGSNRATITMGDAIYARRVLVPRLELLRSVMQERLLPIFDERIIINYESPVVRDHELELEAGKTAPWSQSIDEWRERQGLEQLPDGQGQKFMVPTLLVPTDYAAEPIDVRLDPDDADDLGDLDQPEDDDDAVDDAAAARLFAKAGDLDAARVFRSVLVKDPDDPAAVQIADATFPRYRRAQERAWTALAAAVHDRALLPAIQRGDASAIVDALGLPALRAAITGPLHAYGRPAFLRGAELALRTLPPHAQRAPIAISLQEMNPEAAKWADREAAKLVREIGPETEAAIRALIVDAVATGIPPVEVARRIRAMVGLLESQVAAVIRFEQDLIKQGVAADTAAKRADKYAAAQRRLRATTIARTELMAATNHGQQSLWELARLRGVLSAKTIRVWIVTHDDRLDKKICEPLDGAEAGLNEPFPNGPLVPPAHPRCRCTVGLKTI